MISGSAAARHFGYSSARVKAMESRLITDKTMKEIASAKDVSTIIAILFQGDYKHELEEYGGQEIKSEMIDFALSKNLAKSVSKLIQISPSTERKLIRTVVGKWDLYNVKLAIEAKDRRKSYDSIARYVIDYGIYNSSFIKDAMREESIEGMLGKFMLNSPYRDIIKDAQDEYKKNRNAYDAVAAIDRNYYKLVGTVITGLRIIDNSSARIIKMDIDLQNIMLMIKAKKAGAKFQDIGQNIISSGNISAQELEQIYNSSKDIESMVLQIKTYDLKGAVDMYREGKSRQLLYFEIGIRNYIFNSSIALLKHSILSLGAILAYAYMKEIEIFTLRIFINSKLYGLSREEASRLIIWKSE